MSYYFAIISPTDVPLFTYTFGTSRSGGDGIARFREDARYLNQFLVHASLDVVEEVQWLNPALYHKRIDFHPPSTYISLFLTPTQVRFLLLHEPLAPSSHHNMSGAGSSNSAFSRTSLNRSSSASIALNPASPQTEEAVKQFFLEVYETWCKCAMNPFFRIEGKGGAGVNGVGGIDSPVFRKRVESAGKRWL